MVILMLIRGIFVLGLWGIVIWLASKFGLLVGFAGMMIMVCAAGIEAMGELIAEEREGYWDEEDEES